jgi:transcriptional regulator with XRE-family HTH domain
MIDSDWFYRQLEQEGRSLRDMAKRLGLDPSAVSRMLRGERKMSAEEQDGIAEYLGISIDHVAARRRGEIGGFGDQAQEALRMDLEVGLGTEPPKAVRSDRDVKNATADNFYDRVRGCMKGTLTIAAGVDLTAPTDPEWSKVYDDD